MFRRGHRLGAWALGVLVACGDDRAGGGADVTTATDTGAVTDTTTATETTAVVDTTIAPDTELDTSTPTDTALVTETAVAPETVEATCGCEGGASCLQARTGAACATLAVNCGAGDLKRFDACDLDEVMASCTRTTTIQYHYWARIDGWLRKAKDECASTIVGAGTFEVAEIPAGVGAVCSCRRTAASCVQTYGELCSALTCDAAEGVQASVCDDTGAITAGRCVTRDGQRELVFYAAAVTAQQAETTCHGASAFEYYWFPDGL